MLNRNDVRWAVIITSIFLGIVVTGTMYFNNVNYEKNLVKPFKLIKGDATYEMRCLDGYAYLLYKERNNASITQMLIDNGSSSDRARLAHCKED